MKGKPLTIDGEQKKKKKKGPSREATFVEQVLKTMKEIPKKKKLVKGI